MRKTLIIMAAGLGSRYGGLKQVDTFGPQGETIVEYSIYDALHQGCEHVILVIQEQHEELFEEKIGNKIREKCTLTYVYQGKETLIPKGFDISHREKPRGTAHALLVCKHVVDGPCIVINADDWYGREGYGLLYGALDQTKERDFVMVGYPIKNTIPSHGSVNRGVCTVGEKGILKNITENHAIHYEGELLVSDELDNISREAIVSMNFWGFGKEIFTQLDRKFSEFLDLHGSHQKKEFYISTVCNDLIESGESGCIVKLSGDKRSGVTNKEDKPILQKFIQQKIEEGYYPKDLWNN